MSGDASTLNQDEEAAFAAGFDDDTTATPTETPAEQQDNDTQQETSAAPAEPAAPEYVQLTKAERDELMGLRDQAQRQFGTAFGKIGGIERTLQQLNSGAQVEISQEDIDALKDDFPPLAAALEKVRNLRALPGGGVDQEQIANLISERLAKAEEEREAGYRSRAFKRINRIHPDWRQVDEDPAFKAWVSSQPDEFKEDLVDASQNYDVETVVEAIKLFKQSRKAAPAGRRNDPASAWKSRTEAAVTPRGTGGTAAGDSTDPFLTGFNSE